MGPWPQPGRRAAACGAGFGSRGRERRPGLCGAGLGALRPVGGGPAAPLARPAQAVELQSLWREQACVVAGLRRFGCSVCRWIARDLSGLRGLLDQNGVRLVGVGPEALGLREFLDGGYFAGGTCAPPPSSRRSPASYLETRPKLRALTIPSLPRPDPSLSWSSSHVSGARPLLTLPVSPRHYVPPTRDRQGPVVMLALNHQGPLLGGKRPTFPGA